MNATLINDERIKKKMSHKLASWKTHKRNYPDRTMWWDHYVKKQLRLFVRQEEAVCRNDHRRMENHLYECIYDILRNNTPPDEKLPEIKRYKTKLVKLHTLRTEKVMLDKSAKDRIDGEESKLFHKLKIQKRREARTIHQVRDTIGNITESPKDIIQTLVTYLKEKKDPIPADSNSIAAMADAIPPARPTAYAESLDHPITLEEIRVALRKGRRNKVPGKDGIGLEFYTTKWENIKEDLPETLNHMFMQKNITK